MEAIEGEDAQEFGARIFDLTENGCNLRIKVEEQGGYPTYVSSRFASPSEIPGVSENNVKDIYDQVYDLENVFPVKTYEELQTMLNEHYYGKQDLAPEPEVTKSSVEEEDDLVFDDDDTQTESGNVDDDKVKQLLDTLD